VGSFVEVTGFFCGMYRALLLKGVPFGWSTTPLPLSGFTHYLCLASYSRKIFPQNISCVMENIGLFRGDSESPLRLCGNV